ncbi:hypothetical protein C0J52_15055 [Blattella germanica]|nr:hypothetical protein C0J52_15055 [Blattella germanica]
MKFNVLENCVTPVLLYGCQTWATTKAQLERLRICQRKIERRIMNIQLSDRTSNVDLRERTGKQDIAFQAQQLKWRWARHTVRMHQDKWTYTRTTWDPREERGTEISLDVDGRTISRGQLVVNGLE